MKVYSLLVKNKTNYLTSLIMVCGSSEAAEREAAQFTVYFDEHHPETYEIVIQENRVVN